MNLKNCVIAFKGCLMILKCFFNDLSSSLNNCWVAEKTTKGAAAAEIKFNFLFVHIFLFYIMSEV